MTLTVDFKDEKGFVHVLIKGIFDESGILMVFEKTFLYVTSKEASRVLFDVREVEGDVPWEQITGITEQMSSIHTDYEGFSINKVIIAALTHEKDRKRLSEKVFKESKHNFIVMPDYDEAVKWLITNKVEILQMA